MHCTIQFPKILIYLNLRLFGWWLAEARENVSIFKIVHERVFSKKTINIKKMNFVTFYVDNTFFEYLCGFYVILGVFDILWNSSWVDRRTILVSLHIDATNK